ncbi:hypothetical protein THAOC_00289 [Thalassiosira oceanica]|uniref:SAM domain-containing protein n=1 Tax=Thalassiosira oceanica TaxID=159749 RepID=K3W4F5_THAOC|nr:hypothetical protein THAOC_00289 [Thalassiosira oceanica]|eukprot:EJK77849.1 hypothetical protein THAOC_00289 [Thalassiosira oceanica]
MEAVLEAERLVKEATEASDRSRQEFIDELDAEKEKIASRFEALEARKRALAEQWGNPDASPDDWVEVNCGGRVIAARRGTLCQLEGTNFGAVFSGVYEKKLPRDREGRIFLDLCPDEFQSIIDYLNELSISSPDDLPTIHCPRRPLNEWLAEEGMDGHLKLIYESENFSASEFYEHCRDVPHTVIVVETECGLKIGGYSSTPWTGDTSGWTRSEAFLFVLQRRDGCFKARPCFKAKLADDREKAIYQRDDGPHFGNDLYISDSGVYIQYRTAPKYESHQLGTLSTRGRNPYIIKKIKVYKVVESNDSTEEGSPAAVSIEPATSFAPQINQALNKTVESLNEALGQVERMETSLEDENAFVDILVRGNDCNDLVKLNVSGTTMMTHRSTLLQVKDSVLASQFDDSKWTQQVTSVKTWTPAEVAGWVRNLEGVPDDAAEIFEKNEVTGVELINLGKDELKELGVTRPGTVGILSSQINDLRKASQDSATLIEHSPYCFGKILDYLRMKRLHTLNLIDEVRCQVVDGSQKERFEKVVHYFFPGSQADEILDGGSSIHPPTPADDDRCASSYSTSTPRSRCGRAASSPSSSRVHLPNRPDAVDAQLQMDAAKPFRFPRTVKAPPLWFEASFPSQLIHRRLFLRRALKPSGRSSPKDLAREGDLKKFFRAHAAMNRAASVLFNLFGLFRANDSSLGPKLFEQGLRSCPVRACAVRVRSGGGPWIVESLGEQKRQPGRSKRAREEAWTPCSRPTASSRKKSRPPTARVKQKVRRLNTLLRSFQGAEKPGPEDCGDSISFAQVYQHDRELEKLFRDLGGHVSGLAFIRAVTQLIIDDDKLRMRSAKVAELSMIRSKSGKAFGCVGNCMHSSLLGVQLSCTYTQFGDSAIDSIQSNLSIITGVNNPRQIKLSDTLIGGDRGYDFSKEDGATLHDADYINTVKRGATMPVKFGQTRYHCKRDQLVVSECGPMLVLGWTKPMGDMTAYLTLFRQGTGRCTLLQSSLPSLSSSQIDYVTQDKFIQYAQAFQESSKRGKHDDSPMEPFLDTRRQFILSVFDDHEVTEITCSQGGVEWHKARICFITSTGAHGIIDRDASVYTSDEEALLADDIGLNLTYPMDTDEEEDFQGITTRSNQKGHSTQSHSKVNKG